MGNNKWSEKKRVVICRKGCGLRGLDGARLESYFRMNGCIVGNDPSKADIIVLIACAYKKSKEDECFDMIKELDKHRGELIVAGCLPKISPTRFKDEFNGFALSSKNLDRIDGLFPAFKIKFNMVPDANVPVPLFGIPQAKNREKLPPVMRIAQGCLGHCSYCAIRLAVGQLKSKPLPDCVEEYKTLLAKGHKCILLNAEDVGSYGLDMGSSLPELFDTLYQLDQYPEIFWKIFTFNPNNLIRYKDVVLKYVSRGRIIDIQSDIQSGSQRILKLMNRPYDIKNVVKSFTDIRNANPAIYLRTICLVGFPSETDQEFRETLSVIRQLDLDYILVIPYSDRELTPSSKMPHKISAGIKEKRMELARQYFSRENFKAFRDKHTLTLLRAMPPYEG